MHDYVLETMTLVVSKSRLTFYTDELLQFTAFAFQYTICKNKQEVKNLFNVLSFLSGNALNISKIQKIYKVNKRIIKDFN